jgi:hypothetical protein
MSEGRGRTLWELLGEVRDYRGKQGKRFSLRSMLGLAVSGVLSGCESLGAIAQWAAHVREQGLMHLFEVERRKGPCHATFHNVFSGMDVGSLEGVLGSWVKEGKACHVSIDGKALKGSRFGEYPGLLLLSCYCESLQGVLAELKVEPGTNEITVALKLLKEVPLEGAVVTGDAIFAQKRLCREVLRRGGEYLFAVKDNQPELKADIEAAFAEPVSPLRGRKASA